MNVRSLLTAAFVLVVCSVCSLGCASRPGPSIASIGSGVEVTSAQAKAGIQRWLNEQDVEVVSKRFGSVDGELVIKTAMGHTNIIRYEPHRHNMNPIDSNVRTFIQVAQYADQQERYVDQNYVQGLQQQLIIYALQEKGRGQQVKSDD